MTQLVRQANQKGAFIGRLKLQAAFAALWVLYLEIQEEPWAFQHTMPWDRSQELLSSAVPRRAPHTPAHSSETG